MNIRPLNTTSDYSVIQTAQGSDFSTLLMLLQILFQNKKFHQQPEQELHMTPNTTWSQNNFTTDGQPNSKEYKAIPMKKDDVNKVVKKRQITEPLETDDKDVMKRFSSLYTELEKRYRAIGSLKKELEACRNSTNQKENPCHSIDNMKPLPVPNKLSIWHHVLLSDGFGPGSKIVIRGKAGMNASRMDFNLYIKEKIALRIDNRWNHVDLDHRLILNSYQDNNWGEQVIIEPEPINQGENFVLTIQCFEKHFKICINNAVVVDYTHRIPPSGVNALLIENVDEISSIYYQGYI